MSFLPSRPTGLGAEAFKDVEPSDGGHASHARAPARSSKMVLAALAVLSALTVALLGVSIAALVTAQDAQNSINDLQAALAAAGGNDISGSAAARAGLSPDSLSASYPSDVYTSDSPVPPEGYLFAGSLYRGSGYWSNSSSNLPAPRSHFAAVTVGSSIYVLGGLDASGAPLDSVLAYDALLDLYNTSLAPMPAPRSHLAAAAVNNDTIVVVGGYKDAASTTAQRGEDCAFVYTISTNAWTSNCTGQAIADACASAIDGKVYVAGGIIAEGTVESAIRSYDPLTAQWSDAGALPSARAGAACAALGSTLYVAGGQASDGSQLSELVSFDATNGEVQTLSPLPSGSGDVELVALPGNRLLTVGGIAGTSAKGVQAPSHYVQEYLPVQDAWIVKAPIALARLRAGAAFAEGGMYALGGVQRCTATAAAACSERALADVEVFYDVDHPDVFLHLKDPAADGTPAPPASKVLLSSSNSPLTGYTSMGLLHAGSGYWAPEEGLPVASLSDHAVVPVGNSIYIIGGMLPANETASAVVYEFDTLLSTFTRRAPMPAPRFRAGAAALGGKIYVTGGYASFSEQEGPQETFVYDIETDTWNTSEAELNVPRSDACMAAVAGLLYLGGGYSTNYTETLDSVEVLDPNTNSWTLLARPMPTPRGDVMCTPLSRGGEEQFVVVGGYWDPTNAFTVGAFRTEVEAYSPEAGDWTALAPIPQVGIQRLASNQRLARIQSQASLCSALLLLQARGDQALVTLPGNRMLVMGGETSTTGRNQVASNGVDLFLADHDAWVPMAPLPEPRFRLDAAYANGFVYAFGGSTTSVCSADGASCTARGGAQNTFKYMDISYPDVFVFTSEE